MANNDISNFLNMKLHKFIGFNFDFKPYAMQKIRQSLK